MFKNNIVFKLTTGFVFVILVSTLIIGAFFINLFKDYTFQNRQRNMLQRANQVAKMVEPYMTSQSDILKNDKLINLIDSFINARVWITDKEGSVLAMSNENSQGLIKSNGLSALKYDKEFADKVLIGQEVAIKEYNNYFSELILTVGVPIKSISGKVLGMVILYSPMSDVTSSIDKAFEFLVFAILLEIILAGILGFYYSRFITKPIRIMNSSATQMTNGNYNIRTNIYQKDEIGELSGSLDILAAKLKYTIDQLFQEKNKLEGLFSSMSEGILAFDLNMKIVNYNDASLKILGYDINSFYKSIMLDFEKHKLLDEFKHVENYGQKETSIKQWDDRILKFFISPIKDNSYEIIGVVVLIQDISKQEKLEQLRKDFIANVSHDFRTPLTVIRGSLEALIDKVVPDNEISNYYNTLIHETKGLERMVSDLLNLSRLQSGKIDFNFEEIDITSLALDVSRSMQFIANKKNIIIDTNLNENMPPVWGDYDRLKQLLIIFIDNSIKYSNEYSKITISTDVGEYAYIQIKDVGIGIAKEEMPYIWQRFYKVDKSSKNQNQGTGLGLAIAKYLIELSKGTVSVESAVNEGTTIRIGLPLINSTI